jgi:hypothetical protein
MGGKKSFGFFLNQLGENMMGFGGGGGGTAGREWLLITGLYFSSNSLKTQNELIWRKGHS